MSKKLLEILVRVTCTTEGRLIGEPEVIGLHDHIEELQRWDREKVQIFGAMGATGAEVLDFSEGEHKERYRKTRDIKKPAPVHCGMGYCLRMIKYQKC